MDRGERADMTVTISRWGNSLAVRIPKDVLDQAELHEGDILDVVSERGGIVLTPRSAPLSLDELISRITPENVHSAEFETVVGAEVW